MPNAVEVAYHMVAKGGRDKAESVALKRLLNNHNIRIVEFWCVVLDIIAGVRHE